MASMDLERLQDIVLAAQTPAGLLPLLTQVVAQLPTSLPAQPGVLWNNGGVISVS